MVSQCDVLVSPLVCGRLDIWLPMLVPSLLCILICLEQKIVKPIIMFLLFSIKVGEGMISHQFFCNLEEGYNFHIKIIKRANLRIK